jgi:hypothetical protein
LQLNYHAIAKIVASKFLSRMMKQLALNKIILYGTCIKKGPLKITGLYNKPY